MIELSTIYTATNDGLDIILHYYPQAEKSVRKPSQAFKLREESTPSAYLKKIGTCWRVTDFGESQTAQSPIDICMREENVSFREAIQILAQRYDIEGTYIKAEINKAEIRTHKATPEEIEQNFNFKARETMTDFELSVFGAKVKKEHCDKLGFQALEWYSTTKKNDTGDWITTVIESSDKYPIFLRSSFTEKNEEFYKLYQPFALPYKDKKGNHRNNKFAYHNVPAGFQVKSFINGLSQLKKVYNAFLDEEDEENKVEIEVVICSGERDAVNAYAYGYIPVWLNSETAELTPDQYFTLKKYAKRIYNIPDLDSTGKKAGIALGMKYIDIRTVRLPEKIRQYRDNKGKPRKDLRDYLDIFTSSTELGNLFKVAMPYQFWEWVPTDDKKNGGKWEVNTEFLLNFLIDSGFRKQRETNGKEFFVRIVNNVVREVTARDIRSFAIDFLKENSSDIKLRNTVRNSKRATNALFEDLPDFQLDFSDNTHDSQYFFFENKVVQVKASGIVQLAPKDVSFIYPEKIVTPLNFKRLKPAFTGKFNRETQNIDNISLDNKSSHYFRYLINTSRVHWRRELEELATGDAETDKQYFSDNHFEICGNRLSHEEMTEQLLNLYSKIFTLGYLMHRYKSPSKAWTVWAMETRQIKSNLPKSIKDSAGGTGKSLAFRSLKTLGIKKTVSLNGRNTELTKDKFVMSKVTQDTSLIVVDDCDMYVKFDHFFSLITGDMESQEKNEKSEIIDFSKSPKLVFTSNYPPPQYKDSEARRFQFMIFSDWYHKHVEGKNDYLETRQVSNDFGYDIIENPLYKDEWKNEDINFLIDCLQFFLDVSAKGAKIDPPMAKVFERMNEADMGDDFAEWANAYFANENENLNINVSVPVNTAYNDFITDSGANGKNWNTKRFNKSLKAFCENKGYILNPEELCNADGHITKWHNGKSQKMLFVKTPEVVVAKAVQEETQQTDNQLF